MLGGLRAGNFGVDVGIQLVDGANDGGLGVRRQRGQVADLAVDLAFDGGDATVQGGVGSFTVGDFGGQVGGQAVDGVLQAGVGGRASIRLGGDSSSAGSGFGGQALLEFGQGVERVGHSTAQLGLGGLDVGAHHGHERVVHVRVFVQGIGDFTQRVQQLGSNTLQGGDLSVGVSLGISNAGRQFGSGAEGVDDDSTGVVQAGELDLLLGRVDPDAAGGDRGGIGGEALDVQVLDYGTIGKGNAMKLGISHVSVSFRRWVELSESRGISPSYSHVPPCRG